MRDRSRTCPRPPIRNLSRGVCNSVVNTWSATRSLGIRTRPPDYASGTSTISTASALSALWYFFRHRIYGIALRTAATACCAYIDTMVRTQIQLTEQQAKRVRQIAHEEGVSMAEIIRRWVDRGIQERRRGRAELWEKALAVVGRFEDPTGTADVAERHDEYLDGIYG